VNVAGQPTILCGIGGVLSRFLDGLQIFFRTAAFFRLTYPKRFGIKESTLDESGPERATRPRDGGEEREVGR